MADGVNKVILVGNLGKDPELGYTQGGTPRCKFPVATGESFTSKTGERQTRTEWHNIVVWGKQGENVQKFLKKGRQVYIEGSIRTNSWDDEKTGQKRYMTEIQAQKVVFLGGRGDGDGGGYAGGAGGGGGYQNVSKPADTRGGDDEGPGQPDFGDDDIPF